MVPWVSSVTHIVCFKARAQYAQAIAAEVELVGDGYKWSKAISTSYEKPQYYTISDADFAVKKSSAGSSIYNIVASPARTVGTVAFAIKVLSSAGSYEYNVIGLKDTKPGHLRSTGLSMRLDNGQIYQKGSRTKLTLRPVIKGDVVTVSMDMSTDMVTFAINSEMPVTHTWTGRQGEVRPSVAARATGWEFAFGDLSKFYAAQAAKVAAIAAWAAFEAADPEKAAVEKTAREKAAADAKAEKLALASVL